MNPDLNSLVLYDNVYEARKGFQSHLNEAFRLRGNLLAKHTSMMYTFPEGGLIRFDYLHDRYDVLKLVGIHWQNIFADALSDKELAQFAVAHLFKPVYKGDRKVI